MEPDTIVVLVNGKPVLRVEGNTVTDAINGLNYIMPIKGREIVQRGLKNEDMGKVYTYKVPYEHNERKEA